jgi:hypothetical protein
MVLTPRNRQITKHDPEKPVSRRQTLRKGMAVVSGFAFGGAILGKPVAADHGETQFTFRQEFPTARQDIDHPCTDETLEFTSGIIQIVTHLHIKQNHDFVAHATFNLKNVSLVGVDSGIAYRMFFNQTATIIGNLDDDFPLRETFRGHAGLTSQESGLEHRIWILITFVMTPDFEVVRWSISEGEECLE